MNSEEEREKLKIEGRNYVLISEINAIFVIKKVTLPKIASTIDTMTAIMVAEILGQMTETDTEKIEETLETETILDVTGTMIAEIDMTETTVIEGRESAKDPILTVQEVQGVHMITREEDVMTIDVTKTIVLLKRGGTFAKTIADMIEYPSE